MTAAEPPNALVRRLEQLAAASDGGMEDADLRAVEARLAVLEDTVGRGLLELRGDVLGAVADLRDDVGRTVAELRAGVDERVEQLAATLARGLTELADEIDVAATTTRHTSEQVTVLAELTEVQRAQVAQLWHGVHDDVADTTRALRDELLAHTTEELGALGRRLDALDVAVRDGAADVGERLGAVDARVLHAAGSVERLLAGLEEAATATDRLGATVEGFRAEWPTRTYEVVQGARAVAEAVVLDVRGEVGARLQDVRATLEQVVGRLEAEPDRVLQDAPPAVALRDAAAASPAAPSGTAPGARAPAPRPGVAQGGRGGAAVVPGPGRASAAVPVRRARAVGRPGGSGRPATARGRLDAMPEAPDVDVALEAAAPDGSPDRLADRQDGDPRPS